MAMFELGLSLTAQQEQMSPSVDSYLGGSSEQSDDRLWLQLINNPDTLNDIGRGLSSQLLCDQLVCKVNSLASTRCSGGNQHTKGFESLAFFADSLVRDSNHPFPTACVLSKAEHRVLIVPMSDQPATPYGLYSCLTSNQSLCTFEQ
jgi:hypothetical protein